MATFTTEQKRCIKGYGALHLLKAFFAITVKKQAKTGEFVSQAESKFKKRIAGEQAFNDAMRLKALLGNKDLPIDSETVWARSKEYNARIINCYQVIFKEAPPQWHYVSS
jgi:hypothetical protein